MHSHFMASGLDPWEIEADKSHEPPDQATQSKKHFLGQNNGHGCWIMTVTVESSTLSTFTCFTSAQQGRVNARSFELSKKLFAVTLESA